MDKPLNVGVVIPTIRRQNDFQYLKQSLANHATQLSDPHTFSGRFLFLDKADEGDLQAPIKEHELVPIYRKSHPELQGLAKNSYDYWRAHLCLDFVDCMNCVLRRSTAPFIIWLEDDTYLSPGFNRELRRFLAAQANFNIASANHTEKYHGGFACMIFQRTALEEFVSLVNEHHQEDIPLDWMYKFLGYEIKPFTQKCAFHRGRISSRKDRTMERIVEYEKLVERTCYRIINKIRNAGRGE